MAPFHLAIDQQDRIWVANTGLPHVTRFPASDPSKAENFDTGINNSGLNIDSQGNVWITNRFGTGVLGMAHMVDMTVRFKAEGVEKASDYLTKTMSQQQGGTSFVACGPITAHPVCIQATRFPRLAATWVAVCRCRPISASTRQATSG